MSNYVPVLKSKVTSFKALHLLKPKTKEVITPLFELVPDTENDISKHLSTYWKGFKCYLDFAFLDGDGVGEIITETLSKCRSHGHNVIPITAPDRTAEYQDAITQNSGSTDVAVRFSLSSMNGLRSEEIIKGFYRSLVSEPSRIHVFLDMEEVRGEAEQFAAEALIPKIYLQNLAHFCIIGGSFPGSKDLIEYRNSVVTIPRYEFLLWKAIKSSKISGASKLGYGDYTIRDIELPYSGFITHQIPTLRYTLDSEFYINRGDSNRKHPRGMNQFNDECRDLVRSGFFRGPDFSYGDQQIFEKGTVEGSSPGNSSIWAQIGVNQHIEFVVNQLSN